MCIFANHKLVARSCAYPGVHPKLEKGKNPRKFLEVSLCLEQTTIQTTATRIHRIHRTHRIHRIRRTQTTAQRTTQRTAQTAITTAQRTARAITATTIITTTNQCWFSGAELRVRRCACMCRPFCRFPVILTELAIFRQKLFDISL